MPTQGEATGNNDVFNGKNRVFWFLAAQEPGNGAHGQSLIRWAWCVNWAAGDNCHTINDGVVIVNDVVVYGPTNAHAFVSGHVHTGDWPPVDGNGGGFASSTFVIDHDVNGNATVRVRGSHVGTSGPTSSSDTFDMSLPNIPQLPTAPTIGTAVRVADNNITVNWTNNGVYTSTQVQFEVDNSGVWSNLSGVLAGNAVTYSHVTGAANHRYRYRVIGNNANGSATSAASNAIYTTPGVPTIGTAIRKIDGDIELTWTNNIGYGDNAYTIRVEVSENGTAFTEIAAVNGPNTSRLHASPSYLSTWTYRVRARSNVGSLNSGYSANSNTIPLVGAEAMVFGNVIYPVAGDPTSATVTDVFTNFVQLLPSKTIYPVGAIYMSVDPTNPRNLFGGTWTALQDRFLVGAGGTYAVNATGGEATHVLTADELPDHPHGWTGSLSAGVNTTDVPMRGAGAGDPNFRMQKEIYASETYGSAQLSNGQAHNNLPPYLAVYMWKRIA